MGLGVSLVSPRGTTLSSCLPARLWPSSYAELLASPLGPDGCFLYFDVVLSISGGVFRATVRLARTAMEQCGLTRWNVAELAVHGTLRACMEAKDYAAPPAGVI